MAMPEKDKVAAASTKNANPSGSSGAPSPSSAGAPAAQSSRQTADQQRSAQGGHSDKGNDKDAAASENQAAAEQGSANDSAETETPATESELVAQAQAERDEWKDKHMRLHAEWDTYRRRTSEQRADERARAAEKLVEGLIPVIDDFERTIDYAQKNGTNGLIEGIEAVHAKFVEVLKKDGVEVIDPKGDAFDALEAQAVATVDDKSVPDETVAEVYQKGYRLGRKVLRPAMVTVTTGGPKREVPQEDGQAD